MQTLVARRLITGIGLIEYPVLHIDNYGRIAEIESDPSIRSEDTLASGLFDLHTHGCAGHDVMDVDSAALPAIQRFLATRGVTHYLPTTVTAPIDNTIRALERLADAIETASSNGTDPTHPQALPLGIHLEGPFVSHAKRGVHPPAYIIPPSVAVFDRLWRAARGHIRVLTIAPEEPGALDLIEYATALGVRISIGHSNAIASETCAAIAAGAVSATHTFNAMRPLDHREPGILGVILDDENLFAELICDGVHVAPEIVRLWLKAKGPDRGILITDSMAAAGMPDGEYTLGGMPVTVAGGVCLSNGVLAGSVLTLDKAVANLQAMTSTDLATAVRLASANPARMAGFDSIGEVRIGSVADLTRFDRDGHLVQTYVRGIVVPNPV
jgi:N-acetylglucosamine-6-phosphate deacetylase